MFYWTLGCTQRKKDCISPKSSESHVRKLLHCRISRGEKQKSVSVLLSWRTRGCRPPAPGPPRQAWPDVRRGLAGTTQASFRLAGGKKNQSNWLLTLQGQQQPQSSASDHAPPCRRPRAERRRAGPPSSRARSQPLHRLSRWPPRVRVAVRPLGVSTGPSSRSSRLWLVARSSFCGHLSTCCGEKSKRGVASTALCVCPRRSF